MRLIIFTAVMLCTPVVRAGALPETERTGETQAALAMAFVAEAGWADPKNPEAKADHRAIYHVLLNRWPALSKRYPERYERFVDVVRAYVAALDPRTEKGRRVRWLRALSAGEYGIGAPPTGWPVEHARWDVHRVWWEQALARAKDCMHGRRCQDPYGGRALHWGGAMDRPRGCMVRLPNRGTLNTFYAVDSKCRRRRERHRKARPDAGDRPVELRPTARRKSP